MKTILFLSILVFGFTPVHSQSDTSRFIQIYYDSDSVNTFLKVERDAYFPGGKAAWLNFLSSNLNNDVAKKAAKKRSKHFEQKVIVTFLIEKDGTLSNIKVINDVHPVLRDEAIRVISLSPPWVPAEQNGRKVKAFRQQPITFIVN